MRSTEAQRGHERTKGRRIGGLYVNTFTALAITSPSTVREMSDCNAMVSLAHAVTGMTSVGLNAVLVVIPKMR